MTTDKAAARARWIWPVVLVIVCARLCFAHISEQHMVAPADFFGLRTPGPFAYRVLLPALFHGAWIVAPGCRTHLNPPISACVDLTSLVIDTVALLGASVLIRAAFLRLRARGWPVRLPALAVALFGWTVIFNYLLVPNRSIYYPYDFPELFFMALAAWLGTRGGRWVWAVPPLAFVAALNKETALFLPGVYAVYALAADRLTRRSVVILLASLPLPALAKALSAWWLLDVMNHRVIGPPPVLFEDQLAYNLHQLANPLAWLAWAGAWGGAAFVAPTRAGLRTPVGRAVLLLVLAWLAVVAVVGISREIRLLGFLAIPLLLPLMRVVEELLARAYAPAEAPVTPR